MKKLIIFIVIVIFAWLFAWETIDDQQTKFAAQAVGEIHGNTIVGDYTVSEIICTPPMGFWEEVDENGVSNAERFSRDQEAARLVEEQRKRPKEESDILLGYGCPHCRKYNAEYVMLGDEDNGWWLTCSFCDKLVEHPLIYTKEDLQEVKLLDLDKTLKVGKELIHEQEIEIK